MIRYGWMMAVVSLAGCVPVPPEPAPERTQMAIAASFDRTWDAVIDHFAEANIPIATIEKASGIIATTQLGVPYNDDALVFADCGTDSWGDRRRPVAVAYNVLVRGDHESSTVRVTASWEAPRNSEWDCETTGAWESDVEQAVKERAEALSR